MSDQPFDLVRSRVLAGLSQRALAQEVGVSEHVIRALEAGQPVRLSRAKLVADHFGVTVLDVMPDALDGTAARS